MSPNEAIGALKLINLKGVHPFYDWEEMREVRDIAINALEKQIPKKVIEQTEEDREFIDFICPVCKTTLQQKIKMPQRYLKNTIYKYKFCLHCGQALDWSDTE